MRIAMFMLPAYSHVTATLELIRSLIDDGHQLTVFTSRRHEGILTEIGCDTILDEADVLQRQNAEKVSHGWVVQMMLQSAERVFPAWKATLVERQCDIIISDEALIVSKLLAKDMDLPLVLFSVQGHAKAKPTKLKSKHFRRWFSKPIRFGSFLYDIWRIPKRMQKKYGLQEFTSKSIFLDYSCDLFLSIVPPMLIEDKDDITEQWYFLRPDIASREKAQRHKSAESDLPWEILTDNKCIYISLGTVFNDSKATYESLLNSVKDFDAEVVISVPLSVRVALPQDSSCRFHVLDFVPQILLLQVTDVFITHCGSNSILEAVHFGVPMVGIPQAKDQFGNAERVEKCRLGINLDGRLSVENTRAAVKEMLEKSSESHRLDVAEATAHHPREITVEQALGLIQELV